MVDKHIGLAQASAKLEKYLKYAPTVNIINGIKSRNRKAAITFALSLISVVMVVSITSYIAYNTHQNDLHFAQIEHSITLLNNTKPR